MTTEPRRFCLFPKSLSKSLEPVLKPVYKKHGFAEHRILTEWENIVGAELAGCSVPQKLTKRAKKEPGTLHILVAGGRALELQHMQSVILDRIATYFGYPAVGKLVLTQTTTTLFRKLPRAAPAVPCIPDAVMEALVAECADDGLRSALSLLGARLMAHADETS